MYVKTNIFTVCHNMFICLRFKLYIHIFPTFKNSQDSNYKRSCYRFNGVTTMPQNYLLNLQKHKNHTLLTNDDDNSENKMYFLVDNATNTANGIATWDVSLPG